jgi:D-alanyl-D-alanine dipeptidase
VKKIDSSRPIRELGSVDGWKSLPITECGERLVPLGAFSEYRHISTDGIYAGERHSSPYPWLQLEGSLVTIFVREGIARRLAKAASFLPPFYMLHVWDAYRPLTVQQALFDYYVSVLEAQGMDKVRATIEAQRFVSIPSTDPTRPPPHNTGAAVDLTLIHFSAEDWAKMVHLTKVASVPETERSWQKIYAAEMERLQLIREASKPIEMGTVFDGVHPETATRFFDDLALTSGLNQLQKICQENRRILWNAMVGAGFSNYAEEWWHFDYGNQFDAARTGRQALYGAGTFTQENADWEAMRLGHHNGCVALSERRHMGGSGKIPNLLYSFVNEVASQTGHVRNTIHPQAAAL